MAEKNTSDTALREQEKKSQAGESMTPQEYGQYVKSVTPTHNTPANMAKAFLTGGIICCIGQGLTSLFLSYGIEKEAAGAWTSITLVGAAILLTGLNWFGSIVKFGGAGALVPITGFANSMVSPAIEYKKEGHVFGIGCKIFTIAGPVILFGVFTSWVLGVLYYFLNMMG
jgi:stage V sporulation protein AC